MAVTQRSADAATVDTPIPAYIDTCTDWELIDDLLDGTPAMQDARERWTKFYQFEAPRDYDRRLENTTLFPGFRDAVDRLAVKPFAKDVRLDGELPDELDLIESNADGRGKTLTGISRDLMRDGVARGAVVLFVDHVSIGASVSPVERRQLGLRPVFARIHPRDLIGWEWNHDATGARQLTEVRIHEVRTEKVGKWGQEEVSYIRVIRAPGVIMQQADDGKTVEAVRQPGTWELHRATTGRAIKSVGNVARDFGSGNYEMVDEGAHTFPGVPLVVGWFDEKDEMRPRPPLLDVAYLNLAHWRSTSRQRQYLDAIRVAVLFGSGFGKAEIDAGITISPHAVNAVTSPNANLQWVEHSGKAADAGWTDLDRLKEEMSIVGSEPLRTKSGNPTATGKAIEASKQNTDIENWVRLLEAIVEEAYRLAAQWTGATLPEDFGVDIWSEFAIALTKMEDIEALVKMRGMGDLSRETLLTETKRRGLLGDRVDVEEEVERIDSEGPSPEEMMAEMKIEVARAQQQQPDRNGSPAQPDEEQEPAVPAR